MKNPAKITAWLLLLFLLSSCTSVNRFKSASYKGEDHSLVDMELFGATLEHPGQDQSGKSLWDLDAGAQTQLIKILNERNPGNAQFTEALNQAYLADGEGSFVDFTKNDLRMVFTISRKKDYKLMGEPGSRFSPADRIECLKFSLRIPDEYKLQFKGWNRYATEYGEVEIADVSFSGSIDLSGDISTEYVEGGIKASSGRKEDQAVRTRYLKLNGRISPKIIEMEAEGNREIDLAGNVLADVSLAFEGFPERISFPVYSAGSEDSPGPVTGINFMDILVPRISDLPDSIMATLEMEYIYRHVSSGWKSYQEWDDRVAYYSGRVEKQVSLFNRDQYVPLIFCLGRDEEVGEGEVEALGIRSSAGIDYPLQFLDYREAGTFLEWLKGSGSGSDEKDLSKTIKAGSFILLWEGQPLKAGKISSLGNLKIMPVF